MGLKALQISGNSLVPLLNFYGNSLADRFPIHAEQFNQNINSQSYASAILSRKALDLYEDHLAVNLVMAVQALDLRAFQMTDSYDGGSQLSNATLRLYQAVREVVQSPADDGKSFIWNDHEQALDEYLEMISNDISSGGLVSAAVSEIEAEFESHFPSS